MNEVNQPELYGMREVPNITITTCRRMPCHKIYIDDAKSFEYEVTPEQEKLTIVVAIVDKTLWTSLICDTRYQDFDYFHITAKTVIRSARSGADEDFSLMDEKRFNHLAVSYSIEADADYGVSPVLTFWNNLDEYK